MLCVSVKDGLYENKSQIYPQNDLPLSCKTANGTIIWFKDGNKLEPSNKYIINKTSLVVKNTTPDDTGKLQKIIPFICYHVTTTAQLQTQQTLVYMFVNIIIL